MLFAHSVVLILLFSPVEWPVPHHVPDALWAALIRQSTVLELCGPAGPWRRDDFRAEVHWCRRQWELSQGYPPVADADILPPYWVCDDVLQMNCNWHDLLLRAKYQCTWKADDCEELLRILEWRQRVWNEMRSAQESGSMLVSRRSALNNLRDLLGPEAYYAGVYPSPVLP